MAEVQSCLKQTRSPVDVFHVEHRLEQFRDDERGFTIVESIVALMLIMSVLIGSLAMMGASVKGIVTSRQRSVATSMAREVVERARAADYGAVGHDFDDDTTLNTAADSALSGSPLVFETRRLVASDVDKDPDSPFYPHLRTEAVGSITYTQWAYVTEEVPANGDPFKRVTVVVQWGNDQYAGAVADTVRVETQLFNASAPPDPLLLAEAEVDAGAIRVLQEPAPYLTDDRLTAATLFLPFARSEVESRFVRSVRSLARSPRTELSTTQDSGVNATSPCIKSNLAGSNAECPGVGTSVIADNDAGTAPVVDPGGQSQSVGGGTLSRGNGAISLVLGGSNVASSLATAASTISGNADGLPYTKTSASGPATYSMPFALGTATGSLANLGSPASSEVTVDREGTGTASKISASAQVSHPAMSLLTFDTTPVNPVDATSHGGYAGMVRTDASAIALATEAGPAAAAATFTGAAFNLLLFETDAVSGVGAYRTVSITPGVAASDTAKATFTVNGQPLTVDVTVTATPKVVESNVVGTTTLLAATRLSSWLKVRVDVSGDSTGRVSYELDYGRVVASTSYEAP